MKILACSLAAAIAACAVPASSAMYVFEYSPSQPLFGTPSSASGVFTTSDTPLTIGGQTAFAITSITGTANGSAIVAPTGFYGNYFTTGPAFLDGSGLRFFTEAGSDIRFFFQDSVSRYRVNIFGNTGGSFFVNASSSAVGSAVPEPATWAMLIIGFGLVGTLARRRTGAVAA